MLERLWKIPDFRNPRKCRHKLTVLLLYGLPMFVFQFGSRREVNREMTRPQFEANLRLLFPELETLPHADTLFRVLRDIDVAHIELVQRLIRAKKFRRYLINNCYPIAIEYEFTNAGRQRLSLHVVVCEETPEVVDDDGQTVPKTARHAWLSSRPLDRHNVHDRCNLGARYRWGIEAGFLVEKHQGYHYEHAFALDWNAMKGYHYLMRMAHLFNTLARFARHLKALYAELAGLASGCFLS